MKIAFVYPGQGVQKVGMSQDFFEQYDYAKEMVSEASSAAGIDMEKLLFEQNDDINVTEFTQPALVTACLIITKALEDRGIKPDITAGLSLGEYCSLVTAKAMSFYDAVRLTRIRGKLMSSYVPAGKGTMAAIIALSKETIEEAIAPIDGVTIANYNCPGQIVISGEKEAVHRAMEVLSAAGAKRAIELNVSGPFHSKMLKGAGDELFEELKKAELKPLEIPYIANVNAEVIENTDDIRDLLRRQVYSSVMWEQTMLKFRDMGIDAIVEIGPGKTIAGFGKKTCPEIPVINVSTVLDIETAAVQLEVLANK